jgi:hypothetical protein
LTEFIAVLLEPIILVMRCLSPVPIAIVVPAVVILEFCLRPAFRIIPASKTHMQNLSLTTVGIWAVADFTSMEYLDIISLS